MPQSIIIYRNPAEATFWEMFMSSPYTFPVMVAVVVFLCVAAVADTIISSRIPFEWRKYDGHVTLAASALTAVATFWLIV